MNKAERTRRNRNLVDNHERITAYLEETLAKARVQQDNEGRLVGRSTADDMAAQLSATTGQKYKADVSRLHVGYIDFIRDDEHDLDGGMQ